MIGFFQPKSKLIPSDIVSLFDSLEMLQKASVDEIEGLQNEIKEELAALSDDDMKTFLLAELKNNINGYGCILAIKDYEFRYQIMYQFCKKLNLKIVNQALFNYIAKASAASLLAKPQTKELEDFNHDKIDKFKTRRVNQEYALTFTVIGYLGSINCLEEAVYAYEKLNSQKENSSNLEKAYYCKKASLKLTKFVECDTHIGKQKNLLSKVKNMGTKIKTTTSEPSPADEKKPSKKLHRKQSSEGSYEAVEMDIFPHNKDLIDRSKPSNQHSSTDSNSSEDGNTLTSFADGATLNKNSPHQKSI